MSEANHFSLLGLAPDFNLDLKTLGECYREQAGSVHPDRFARAGEAAQQQALKQTARLNEAYRTLKNPASRALYLLTLSGCELQVETTVQDSEFLVQQMQWREDLEEITDSAALNRFTQRLQAFQIQTEQAFAICWQSPQQRETAEKLARRLQFLSRLADEVRTLEERFDDLI